MPPVYGIQGRLFPAILFECCKAEVFGAPAFSGGVRGGDLRAFKWNFVEKKFSLNKLKALSLQIRKGVWGWA